MRGERVSAGAVARAVNFASRSRRRRARDRLVVLVCAVEPELDSGAAQRLSTLQLITRIEAYLREPTPAKMWLTIAVLTATYPLADDVMEASRSARLDGSAAVLKRTLFPSVVRRFLPAKSSPPVEVARDCVLVDVDHTSTVAFATGIQRVVRETVSRWVRDHDPILVGWTPDRTALRRLSDSERSVALTGAGAGNRPDSHVNAVLVPLGGTYVLPELTLDRRVALRLASLAEMSSTDCSVIGFDAVPLSSAETTDFMVSGGFANNLAAVKHMSRVATISQAAASEYSGWKLMLVGSGIAGPKIRAVPLAHEMPKTNDVSADVLAEQLGVLPDLPLVLCVGSHEPRKNHLAVLHAAEGLWRSGCKFQLLFVGGNAWNSGLFTAKLDELMTMGRPVSNTRAVSDELLGGAYKLAAFSVFPSLNEGYGLPIVESLSVGTPVVTSDFGSMREITTTGGALYVDPRSDQSVEDGMRRMLLDEELRRDLTQEASRLPRRSWDDYASETWTYLVDG